MPRRSTETRAIYLPLTEPERAIVGDLVRVTSAETVPEMLRNLILQAAKRSGIKVTESSFKRRLYVCREER